ncbi:hypothetical protein HYFRA_00011226 [Hymenoscyphus fraxineus]|uniref:Uncharacterized protein n=1 Tax=Hymenoscyphus fraxineus TaxID=746836 RepID=A0A9N9KWN4_9HELO|nr:hypothetical protein HYFRA_00011226 [Hymenoscyphus fraxineus]
MRHLENKEAKIEIDDRSILGLEMAMNSISANLDSAHLGFQDHRDFGMTFDDFANEVQAAISKSSIGDEMTSKETEMQSPSN